MDSLQQRIRRRQRLEGLCAATIRAISGQSRLQYRGRCLVVGDRPLRVLAPHLRLAEDASRADYRGAADGMALRLLYSDLALFQAEQPTTPVARLMFDWLEQLRVESLAPDYWPGMGDNLARRFYDWSRAFHRARYTEGELGELVYTVIQVCWAGLMRRPVWAETEGLIETRRGEIAPAIGYALAGLRRTRHDQAAFTPHALSIAAFVADHLPAHVGEQPEEDENDRAAFSLLLDFDENTPEIAGAALSENASIARGTGTDYHVFSTAYDAESSIETDVRAEQLADFRARLDTAVAELPVNIRRLVRYLRERLAVPERSDWQFGEEAGYIDGRRLARIVSSPAERRVFKLERVQPRSDAVVGILIDCSGSMKMHGAFVALVVDRLATALNLAGAQSEILGFTTGAWSGGRVQQDWMRAGRPPQPGRLNEVRYLLFKPMHRPWRRARRTLGALLKPDLYREGIDGEAVDWACTRLAAADHARRILVVISDGCPMDSATQLANGPDYLDEHLKQVVARRAREGQVAIRGLGIGLDLSPFYPRSLVVDPQAPIDNNLMLEITQLMTGPVCGCGR